jgi:predicted nucleotidyltransferase
VDYTKPVQTLVPGVQGRVLAVLAATDTELTMRTVASLADVSVNRAASVLNELVDLGIVRRRDVGRAALVCLERENEAARLIVAMADIHQAVLRRLRETAKAIRPVPASLVIFGSFAAGLAGAESDVDVLAVRPPDTAEDDTGWADSLGAWVDRASRVVGNPVNLLTVGEAEVAALLGRRRSVWREIAENGVVLIGARLEAVGSAA